MANVERFGLFYAPWPVIDGKPIQYQWGEIRHDTAETKAIVRNSFQELQEGQEELNALRALLGQAFGDLVFSNRYRFYYNKSTFEFCLQKNDGTVEVPIWTDVWCVRLSDGQFMVESQGGISSVAGFYGPGLENINQIGETGSEADESYLHRSKLFFNTDDGFELDEITSGGNAGGVEVRYTAPFGKAEEFPKVGKEWVVLHNFGISPVLVQVMDDDKRIITPDTADVSDPNIAYFYFNEVTSGSVYIASGGIGATSLVPRDPFYLVVRTDGQSSDLHRLYPNADLIFDSTHFYVNVSLVDKSAFVSLVGPGGGFVTAAQGDRNIAAESSGGTISVRLQPVLTGMEAFYFKNGDAITHGDSIHFEVAGTDRMSIGKDGLRVEDKVKAEAFYTDQMSISRGDIGSALVEATGQLTVIAGGSTSVEISGGPLDVLCAHDINIESEGDLTVGVAASVDGVTTIYRGDRRLVIGGDGAEFNTALKAPAFYLAQGDSGVAWDLSEATIEIHLPSPSANTPYFLVNFVDQPFIVKDVKLACTAGTASFGFYTQNALEYQAPRGVGIVGEGSDDNTLGEFYVAPVIRTVTATANNIVGRGGSLTMVCLSSVNATNVRGRVAIRLQG